MRTRQGISVMRRSIVRAILGTLCLLADTGVAPAQFGRASAEWMTDGADAQRSHWIPSDSKISVAGLEKPGFQFLWKVKLSNEAVQLNSLTNAILMDRYIGYRGFRSLAFLGGSSNTVAAVDTDLARIEWQRHLPLPAPIAGSVGCPGGLTANLARPTSAAYPPTGSSSGGLGGRSGPAQSAVGEPDQGAVTIAAALAANAAGGRGPGRGPNVRPPELIYAIAGDGTLRALYLSNGEETNPPIHFLPSDSNAKGFVVLDGIAYVATESCNGAHSAIWALDLASKQLSDWQPSNGTRAGIGGPAFGPDGTGYATTTVGALVALDPKTLQVKDGYTSASQRFSSSPAVFPYKGRNLVAAATSAGQIQIFDAAFLRAKPLSEAPPYSAAPFAPGALATWQSADGTRWVLAAAAGPSGPASGFQTVNGVVANGAIAAWKLVDRNGAIALEPGWLSRDLISPLPPMIINGVVFALSSGEFRSEDSRLSAPERIRRSVPAVLYALDGTTGKVLWDSGKTITSFVHSGALSGQSSQVYLETYDETLYAFGFPLEH